MNDIQMTVTKRLYSKNIKPSLQRIKVLEYLEKNHIHPTADQIFMALHEEIPTLSKATIYNTLTLFIEADLVRLINIEDTEMRYDIILEDHGHFKCESCGSIYDFSLSIEELKTDELQNFLIHDKNVYYKGICPRCLSNKNK